MSKKREDHGQRKLDKGANGSYRMTLPIEIIRSLKWRDGQKVIVEQKGDTVVIKDWKR